jgi:ankyrin repeat protein
VSVWERYTRRPHEAPRTDDPVDEFLRLACLTYSNDDPARWEAARAALAERPDIARASLHAAAAAGDVEAARERLADVTVLGGPHRWEPLLYLAYSRVTGDGALDVARLLIGAGADVDAGFLWDGLSPPFTALTGAFGRGEGDPPPHRDSLALARLLLEGGADPNDAQAVYNLSWTEDDGWLSLLLAFGFGRGDGGPWHARLAPDHPTPRETAEDCLMWAARHGHPRRVELLVAAGVDPDGQGTRHPILQGRSAIEVALLGGETAVAEALRAADVREPRFSAAQAVEAAYMCADATVTAPPPAGLIARAAERGRGEAVALLLERGADVNATGERATALHEAALRGDTALTHQLLAAGADPTLHDHEFNATPAGWAEHAGHPDLAAFLTSPKGV